MSARSERFVIRNLECGGKREVWRTPAEPARQPARQGLPVLSTSASQELAISASRGGGQYARLRRGHRAESTCDLGELHCDRDRPSASRPDCRSSVSRVLFSTTAVASRPLGVVLTPAAAATRAALPASKTVRQLPNRPFFARARAPSPLCAARAERARKLCDFHPTTTLLLLSHYY